jgi:hypothetical protein
MPYIKQEERVIFDSEIDSIINKLETPAQATYVIYKIIKKRFGKMGKNWNDFYTKLSSDDPAVVPKDRIDWEWKSEGTKVLKCAMDEYNRKVIVPHEIDAENRNGSI